MMKIWMFIFGLVFGFVVGFTFRPTMLSQFDVCVNELLECQEALNDPHHCVSIVEEVLEAKHE